jgi:gamma-glutamylcyclotransferase (GGCT)/AIG2-like uncharacterized protein YtfP
MYDIRIFCYGTLKKRQKNHSFCRRAVSIEEATVCGNLYQLPPGFPALQVPSESVMWSGTKDVFADAQNQYKENNDKDFEFKIYEGWSVVHGELVTFSDPERDVIPIDKLEGFPWYYGRDLIPVKREDGSVIVAWAYTLNEVSFSAELLPDGVWPECVPKGE